MPGIIDLALGPPTQVPAQDSPLSVPIGALGVSIRFVPILRVLATWWEKGYEKPTRMSSRVGFLVFAEQS
jgi:hypothetical protein